MSNYSLQFVYETEEGKERQLTIAKPRLDLTNEDVKQAMNVLKGAFEKFKDVSLTNKEAKIIETRVAQTFDRLAD